MKKPRTRQEQAVAATRVAAAVRLQNRRPQVHVDQKKYDRSKEKRLWQNDRGGAFSMPVRRVAA
jgi:hypothetical protein